MCFRSWNKKIKISEEIIRKDEETSRLKNLNQILLEQIRKLKDEKLESQNIKNKVNKSENEELACLKNHNQNLLTQIKNIKNDKKSLENKLELLIKRKH
jgi:hypothetical protein